MSESDAAQWVSWVAWVQVALLVGFLFALLGTVALVGGLCAVVTAWRERSNCLIEALRLMREQGGYLLVRPGRELVGVPHCLWLPAAAVETHPDLRSFVPLKAGPRRLPVPTDFVYRGAVKSCDQLTCTNDLPQCGVCEWRTISQAQERKKPLLNAERQRKE